MEFKPFPFENKSLTGFMTLSVALSGFLSIGIVLHRNYKAALLLIIQGFILYAFWKQKNWVLPLLFLNALGYLISGFLTIYSIVILSKLHWLYSLAGGGLFILGIAHFIILNRTTTVK